MTVMVRRMEAEAAGRLESNTVKDTSNEVPMGPLLCQHRSPQAP